MTFSIAVNVASSINNGLSLMIQLTPSEQGGVVSDPAYRYTLFAANDASMALNSKGPVVDAVPGLATFATLPRTSRRTGSAVPRLRKKATTALALSAVREGVSCGGVVGSWEKWTGERTGYEEEGEGR